MGVRLTAVKEKPISPISLPRVIPQRGVFPDTMLTGGLLGGPRKGKKRRGIFEL